MTHLALPNPNHEMSKLPTRSDSEQTVFWGTISGRCKGYVTGNKGEQLLLSVLTVALPGTQVQSVQIATYPRLRCPLVKAVPDPDGFFLRPSRNNAVIRVFGKLDLPKIRASLNTPCPRCGHTSRQKRERTSIRSTWNACSSMKSRCKSRQLRKLTVAETLVLTRRNTYPGEFL